MEAPDPHAPDGQPAQIGRYRVASSLGRGVFGTVYLAHDDQSQRMVAIKVPHRELTANPEHLAACLAEARRFAAIDHPHVVPVFEVGSTADQPCFTVSRFIEGMSLQRRIAESRLPRGEAARLVGIVASALHAAHLRRIVHGNIKPSNLLLDRRGDVFLKDFSPQIVRGRRLTGTPEYMSPEQIRGEEHRIEPRSDIFSLGIVFYELLTGRRPFAGDSIERLAKSIVAAAPTPPRQIDASIPTELERVCLKMLRPRLVDRYESAQELAEELLGLPGDAQTAAVERGLRVGRGTFVFTDFKGFTERVNLLEQAAGPRAAAEMKRTVACYVDRALSLVDGSAPPTAYRLIDTAGDGFFLHFRAAEAAYRFARALKEATAGHNKRVSDTVAEHWFRTGAATGEVAWDGDKPVGNVVNVSARHQAACTGGDFIIDEATYVDLPPDIRPAFGPPESIRDKNGAVHVVRRTGFGRPLAPLASAASAGTTPSAAGPPPVVPKGLRSFDASDSEFFLELVPGPRNLQGLPDSIRLIKARIEARDPGDTFAVGCVYGPSGCGKSSLIKAGVLPRLSPAVITIFVEASANDTEKTLMGRLRARFPDLPPHCGLTEAVTTLRRGELIPEGGKLLMVIDQFEQWLQSHGRDCGGDLASALRQCDGTHVQCFVMVRDDYWVTVNRFMFDIDVRLVERANSAMIDLFDSDHATKVLAQFGRAYGRLPDDPGAVSREQTQFLLEAIEDLAVDGKVVPVRLALFAEMMKAKPWQPAVLRKLGGAAGVGVAFLEETFGAKTVSARHRHHQNAARAVLKCLLPDEGGTIRRPRTRRELREASGYGTHPADFSGLIDLLDSELRLIVAISEQDDGQAAGGGGDDGVSYQLAHDYLVPSLREWLTRGQKETRRGRAELLLADRATVWNARRERRQLPSLWQCVQIRWWTRRRDWTQPQQAMMREAGRYYLSRSAILIAAVLVVAGIAREFFGNLRATVLRDRLIVARIRDVPAIVHQIEPYRSRVQPLLEAASREQATRDDPVRDLAIHLALLPADDSQVEPVVEHLFEARPQDVGVIVASLEPYKRVVSERFWARLGETGPQTAGSRIRAACGLAAFEPDSPRWDDVAGSVAALMVNEEPLVLGTWSESLRPVSARLVPPLTDIFLESPSSSLRGRAASVLGDYLSDQPNELAELLLDDFVNGYTIPFMKIERRAAEVIPVLLAEIDRVVPESSDGSVVERAAKRKANAAVGLMKLGRPEQVWGLLRQSSDPRMRSYVIDRMAMSGAGSIEMAARLAEEPDVSVRRAILLILGSYAEENIPSDVRQRMVPRVREMYRHDPDPGIHGASKWVLRMWRDDAWLRETDAAVRAEASGRAATQPATAIPSDPKAPCWHVNAAGQTMVVIPGPVEFSMGSSKDDDAATFNDPVHPKRIGRTYAIADAPVTIAQFREFKPDYALPSSLGRAADLPAVRIDWYTAAAYCNFLSKQDGIPPAQWCYEDVSADGRVDVRPKRNLLALAGYRLPTEAETEFATRAGSTTDRPYGESEELLSRYAWTAGNSSGMTHPVGRLKPNDYGLFDTLGNVLEWSQNIYLPDPQERLRAITQLDDVEDEAELHPGDAFRTVFRAQRGGSFMHSRWETRSATRINYAVMTDTTDYMGFRVARTVRVFPPK